MSSLLVTSVLWPRYAREEFVETGRAALKTVNQLVSAHVRASIDPANVPSETESLLAAISDEFNILTTARSPGEKLRSSRLNESFAALQEKVNEIRDHGITFGMFIGTVLGRLLWPVLPQRVLRDNLLAVFAQIKALLKGDPHREKI